MNVISKPHLPQSEASLFICDSTVNLPSSVKSFVDKNILDGINSHPDMTFCPLFNGDVIVTKNGYEYYKEHLPSIINIIKGENDIRADYPFDIAFNAVIIDNKLFHNLKYTDKGIIRYCKNKGIEMINVKQGYTKCSTLIVDEKSVITCDKKLNDIYISYGLNSLVVSNDEIKINNFDHGFIGGCGGKISKNVIGFFGDITKHKDFCSIKKYLYERQMNYKILIDGPLFDYGSLIPICT